MPELPGNSQSTPINTGSSTNQCGQDVSKQGEATPLLNRLIKNTADCASQANTYRSVEPFVKGRSRQEATKSFNPTGSLHKPTIVNSYLKGRKMSSPNQTRSSSTPMVTFENQTARTCCTENSQDPTNCTGTNHINSSPDRISPKKTRFSDLQTSVPGSPVKSANVKGSFV